MDRLRHLEDKDVHRRLQVSAEVPVSIRAKDIYGNDEIIRGRADWALGYGTTKNDTGAILLVVEAKPHQDAAVGMPQLLVYMCAVQEARQGRINRSVFGMLSDSKEFRFSFLNENKKLFISEPLVWAKRQATIIAYIDMMLISAIESSPHTIPQKFDNRTIFRYSEELGRKWQFGEDSREDSNHETTEDGGELEGEGEMVDIVDMGDHLALKYIVRADKSRAVD